MVAIIKTVSLNSEESEFLVLNNLSPTGLLKQKIKEIQENQLSNKKIEQLMDRIHKFAHFLVSKNLLDEFNNWKEPDMSNQTQLF